ncbi:uncharacterized protein N0V89_008765 [Didymosphaeria variabile]|uniref:Uncharacterized protein n=1 Tax=Didymosphaeria variabile TaxID=1932322 RepID=A0A9W8XI91_9PLEO|nr:uncharacterized protein N0V89_008765 [Didymosphaeria variabile]KAJ4350144.1 hypothetical protein N0V89_008765 [Didymosphaeria variabile]
MMQASVDGIASAKGKIQKHESIIVALWRDIEKLELMEDGEFEKRLNLMYKSHGNGYFASGRHITMEESSSSDDGTDGNDTTTLIATFASDDDESDAAYIPEPDIKLEGISEDDGSEVEDLDSDAEVKLDHTSKNDESETENESAEAEAKLENGTSADEGGCSVYIKPEPE